MSLIWSDRDRPGTQPSLIAQPCRIDLEKQSRRDTWAHRHPVANDLLVTLVLVAAMLFVAWCLSQGGTQ